MSVILLSANQMRTAEQAVMKRGTSSEELMERAGQAVFNVIIKGYEQQPTLILCGPGNNGGDGFVVARLLKEAGWPVRVGLLGERAALQGDAAAMAERCDVEIEKASPQGLGGVSLIIDGLFGLGLNRPLEGEAKALIEAVNAARIPVVAVDIPSGVNADTGAVMGVALQARQTVTFFTSKPGHLLYPGRAFCGETDITDIGMTLEDVEGVKPNLFVNDPRLWGRVFPRPSFMTHKYARGAAAVISGQRFGTGAARLAAVSALRAGAGVVTMVSSRAAADENAAHLTSVMLRVADTPAEAAPILTDPRYRAALIGPGAGVGPACAAMTQAILQQTPAAVVDADALSSFAADPESLFGILRPQDVITPHVGEFMRLFGGLIKAPEARLEAARLAAQKAGCVVVLKGADTIIASPDGRAAINVNAPPDLATAGTGDVLAGIILGQLAQAMPSFEAACAGAFLQGAAAQAGAGLIAEDLPDLLPKVLRALLAPPSQPAS